MSALHWQKSSFSGEANGCVYVAAADDGTIKLHESDDPAGAIVTTTPEKLRAFILGVKAGEFDHFVDADIDATA
ncbi:hypothetical protein QR77_25705 [Streptomyces sp. 150FB]|uniref:DUF397 domain-containing protein n=1 Tax=Streptomyces sp. 150FB TaxID=1576605 RepID=UPI0005895273|nr:DUF397 domain-containing protein [Streptomyces sp. 150FB]KIF76359.1 hypothetical protein QR77_25705 [Streptomyces sp. 150FB]